MTAARARDTSGSLYVKFQYSLPLNQQADDPMAPTPQSGTKNCRLLTLKRLPGSLGHSTRPMLLRTLTAGDIERLRAMTAAAPSRLRGAESLHLATHGSASRWLSSSSSRRIERSALRASDANGSALWSRWEVTTN